VTLDDDHLELEAVARFANGGHDVGGIFSWDLPYLLYEIEKGLGEATRRAKAQGLALSSVGVDSWAVDYGLLDAAGHLVRPPAHHRDPRTQQSIDTVTGVIDSWALYQRNGIAPLTFNTLFQLVADGEVARSSDRLLLIPDLVNYYLSGRTAWEITNASTTQLLNRQRDWDDELFEMFALSRHLVGDLVRPGDVLGPITSSSAASEGVSSATQVIAVASHDTASAVLAVPAQNENFAYISSGTWSLVGVELTAPLIDVAAFEAGYSNELGAFGRTRFLRNVMGFWLLQEVIREYALDGRDLDAATLTNDALSISPRRYLVDAESDELLGPGHMRERLVAQCEHLGTEVPSSAPEFARCIIDSLALAYRRALRGISAVSGVRIDAVHVVGGGALNDVLCQLTADACGTPVYAGPVEAAALGNALVQLAALGHVETDLWSMRQLMRSSFPTTRFQPNPNEALAWKVADDILEAART